MTETVSETDLFCPGCGYNLRGTDSARCPECGLAIDRALIGASVLPWLNRSRIGLFAALFRTIFLVTRQPSVAARQAAAPVRLRDAQRFRLMVILLAALPLISVAIVLRVVFGDALLVLNPLNSSMQNWPVQPLAWWVDFLLCFLVGVRMWLVPSLAMLLALLAVSGAASYFFDVRNESLTTIQRNRAVGMSFYACAPLAFMVIPVALAVIATLMSQLELNRRTFGFNVFGLVLVAVTASILFILGAWYNSTLRLLRLTTHCSNLRFTLAALILPFLWIALATFALIGFPILCGYVKLLVLGSTEG